MKTENVSGVEEEKQPQPEKIQPSSTEAKKFNCRNTLSKTIVFLKSLTIEPFIFFFMFANFSRVAVTSQLLLDKSCRVYFNYSHEFCINITDEAVKNDVQRIANSYNIGLSLVGTIPAVIAGIFIGPWSDKYGRKIPMIVAVINPLLDAIQFAIFVYIWEMPMYLLLLIQIPTGFLGGMSIVLSSAYSYISETVNPRDRPMRFAVMQIFLLLGMTSAQVTSGGLFRIVGYGPIMLMSLAFCILSIVWLAIMMKDSSKLKEPVGIKKMLRDLFSFDSLKENFRTCTKPREGNMRAQIYILIFCMSLVMITFMGTGSIAFFYVKKRLQWEVSTYNYVKTISRLVDAALVAGLTPLLSKKLGFTDPIFSGLGIISLMADNICQGFAKVDWIYYIALALGCVSGFAPVGIRNRMSKLIPRSEMGKVFMMLGIVESIVPLIGTSVFGSLYNHFLYTDAGMPLIIAGIFPMIALLCLIWIYFFGTDPEKLATGEAKDKKPDLAISVPPGEKINEGFEEERL